MANKRYDQFASTAPTTSRILLTADAGTGTLGKCTTQDILSLQAPTQTLLSTLQSLGSPVLSFNCGINPIQTNGSAAINNQVTTFYMNYLPACTVTGVWYSIGLSGVFTANNFNGYALFSKTLTGLSRIAITANDGNIFKTGFAVFVQVPFTAPVTVTAGAYWLAQLFCSSSISTNPLVRVAVGSTNYGGNEFGIATGGLMVTNLGSQTSMVSTVAWTSLPQGNFNIALGGLY